MAEDRRLIEETFPIKEVGEESAKEKSIRQGNISTLHIWWARRPIIACRAAVFASLMKDPQNATERKEIVSQLIGLSKWKASNDYKAIKNAQSLLAESCEGKRPRVLDCFAGGGAIPLECTRLGCEAYALELNPVACLLEFCTLVYPQKFGRPKKDSNGLAVSMNPLVEGFKKWAERFIEGCRAELGEFYPKDTDGAVPVAYLWTRVVKCPNPGCGAEIPLLMQYLVSTKESKKVALKPRLDQSTKTVEFDVVENEQISFDASERTIKRGSVRCFFCNQTADVKYLRAQGQKGQIEQKMMCVILLKKDGGKKYRKPNSRDIEQFKKAETILKGNQETKINGIKLCFDEPLPPMGTLGFRIQRYGFKTWADLYNPRQLLMITTMIKKIQEIKEGMKGEIPNEEKRRAILAYIACAIDRLATFSTNLSLWVNKGEFIGQVFSQGQAIPMRWDYAEVNPFGGGSGDWSGAVDWIMKVIEQCSMQNNQMAEPVRVSQGSATDLPYDKGYFDAVITDPPYYDAVPYADLSDFFYVILKRSIGDLYRDLFSTPLSPKKNEIIQEPVRHQGDAVKAKMFFEEKMTRAFQEISNSMKDNGILTVFFSHKTTSAWETIINSLLNSQFVVTASWPVHTERPGRLRSHESAALASSILIVCRKRNKQKEGFLDEIRQELKERIRQRLDEFWKQGIRGADFFISAIGPSANIFGKYEKVRKLSGEEVTVAQLLDLTREIVTDYSLRKILHEGHLGSIDEETRFYVLWRWAYNNMEIVFDEARKLAQALGAEPDRLMTKSDLLRKKGEKVRLLGPKERAKDISLGQHRPGMPVSMIDALHKSCLLWEKGDRKSLQEYLTESEYQMNESFWNVAQALSEILLEGDKERQLIQGLLASKEFVMNDSKTKGQTTLPSFGEETK